MFDWLHSKTPSVSEEKRRVRDALADYPLYRPPVWSSEAQSMQDAAGAYRAYFLGNRTRRIEALHEFLAKFAVEVSLEDNGVREVSAWCPMYAHLLVDGLHPQESDDLWCAYYRLETPWTDLLVGLNPIFDLGVFIGECMLYRNPSLKWLPTVGSEPNGKVSHSIFGQQSGGPFDPIEWTYTKCKNIHSAQIAGKSPDVSRLRRCVQTQVNQ